MSDRDTFRAVLGTLVFLAIGVGGGSSTAAAAARAVPSRGGPAAREEFLIVSSIDAAHHRIVLKRPTEVTLVVHVSERTVYRDEAGRALHLADLRAGDTAYVTLGEPAPGAYEAVLVRLGPMTVEELQKRFLRAAPPP
jgi:hypothetical protein